MEPPVLSKCYLCGRWSLAEDPQEILIPDQVGHVRKLACGECLSPILKGSQDRQKGVERDEAMRSAWSKRRMEKGS